METPKRFNLTYHHGAYYVSQPNIRDMEVIDAASYDALLADRDAWKAKAEAATVPVARRLREVKGVSYDPERGAFGSASFGEYAGPCPVARMIAECTGLTDADHAAIYALKDDPWEPVEGVEDLVQRIFNVGNEGGNGEKAVKHYAARIRQAVHAEQGAR